MARKTTVVLGAGASKDADLPLSTELTRQLAREVDARVGRETAQALHVVIGSIIAHETRLGASSDAGVDVERAFSAIKMLSERDRLEVAPFVGSWTDSSLRDSASLPPFWARKFKEAIGSRFDSGVESAFRDGVIALTSRSPSAGVYLTLMRIMVAGLVRILSVEDASRFSHLLPIFDLEGVRVATLNYDLGVELAASLIGLQVDRGIQGWTGGVDWHWSGEGIPLLKLHGSIDWTMSQGARPSAGQPGFALPWIDVGPRQPGQVAHEPAIIFGAREKLRADGPFLAMLFEFGRWLQDTDDLVVVGYSFRDDHINVAIRDWLGNAKGKTLTIIDPAFPSLGMWDRSEPFTQDLNRAMHPSGPPRVQPNGEATIGPEVSEQFRILRMPASEGLLDLGTHVRRTSE